MFKNTKKFALNFKILRFLIIPAFLVSTPLLTNIQHVKAGLEDIYKQYGKQIGAVYIEQSLQSFRSGFSSAKTISTLARFNGIVSWLVFDQLQIKPEYIAATSARKLCGIKIPRGEKAKPVVLKFLLDSEPQFTIEYTRQGNPKPESYDRADSLVVAKAGVICERKKKRS